METLAIDALALDADAPRINSARVRRGPGHRVRTKEPKRERASRRIGHPYTQRRLADKVAPEATLSGPLLLVAPDSSFTRRLRTDLESDGFEVDWAKDLCIARAAAKATDYDTVVADLNLPDGSGPPLVSLLRQDAPGAVLVAFTSLDSTEERIATLDVGADVCLSKPFPVEELLAHLRARARRSWHDKASTLRCQGLELDSDRRTVRWQGETLSLANREFALLDLLLRNEGRVVARAAIETALFPANTDVESNALEVYVHKLRRRFGAELIRTVRSVGYVVDLP